MCENPRKGLIDKEVDHVPLMRAGSRSLLCLLVYRGLFLGLFLDLLDLSIEEGTHFYEENY